MIMEILLGIMTFIQTLEVYWLLKSNRRTNEILENPAPVIEGLMEACREDKEFAAAFDSFLAWSGQCAIAGFKAQAEAAGVKVPKIKNIGDLFSFALQMPAIQQAIEKKVQSAAGGAVEKVADKAMIEWGL